MQKQLGHATASMTLDVYGHRFPDELDALAGRLEAARADAVASLARTSTDQRWCRWERRGSGSHRGVGGATTTIGLRILTESFALE